MTDTFGKRDEYWRETIEREGLAYAIDLARSRLHGFKANNKLSKQSEGWAHLDCTGDLLVEIYEAVLERKKRKKKRWQ